MQTIAIVILYFGKLPNYFDLFLESAAKNNTIDFYLFTDTQPALPEGCSNIYITHSTLEQCKVRIENAVGYSCCLEAPYKLCDYRPSYGLVFADYLAEYDWWGFCDVDVILGDLRKFLTNDILQQYEKFSNLGHLMLFKNTTAVNKRFMCWKTGAYNTFFEAAHSRRNVAFDEKGGLTGMSKGGLYATCIDYKYIADIWPDTYHFRTFYNYRSDAPCVFSFCEGKLFGYFIEDAGIQRIEFMYIHLQARNMKMNIENGNAFLVLPDRFAEFEQIDEEFIRNESIEKDKKGIIRERSEQPVSGLPFLLRITRKLRRFVFSKRNFIAEG